MSEYQTNQVHCLYEHILLYIRFSSIVILLNTLLSIEKIQFCDKTKDRLSNFWWWNEYQFPFKHEEFPTNLCSHTMSDLKLQYNWMNSMESLIQLNPIMRDSQLSTNRYGTKKIMVKWKKNNWNLISCQLNSNYFIFRIENMDNQSNLYVACSMWKTTDSKNEVDYYGIFNGMILSTLLHSFTESFSQSSSFSRELFLNSRYFPKVSKKLKIFPKIS